MNENNKPNIKPQNVISTSACDISVSVHTSEGDHMSIFPDITPSDIIATSTCADAGIQIPSDQQVRVVHAIDEVKQEKEIFLKKIKLAIASIPKLGFIGFELEIERAPKKVVYYKENKSTESSVDNNR